MLNRPLVLFWRQMKIPRILTHVCLNQIGCFFIVVTQKLVLKQSKNVTAKCTEPLSPLPLVNSPCTERQLRSSATAYHCTKGRFFYINVYVVQINSKPFSRVLSVFISMRKDFKYILNYDNQWLNNNCQYFHLNCF